MWPADTEAEAVVIRPCVYQCGNITGVNASRTCLGSGSWSTTDFTNCPTERTCQLVNLTEVHIYAMVCIDNKDAMVYTRLQCL